MSFCRFSVVKTCRFDGLDLGPEILTVKFSFQILQKSKHSGDPKFHKLIDYALNAKQTNEIGMIGFNPHTGKPLNMGVSQDVMDAFVFLS